MILQERILGAEGLDKLDELLNEKHPGYDWVIENLSYLGEKHQERKESNNERE